MTVCVAAITRVKVDPIKDEYAVVIASDRMMTSDDFQYEPPTTKLATVGPKCVIMVAGDFTVQSEILFDMRKFLDENPTESIRDIAEIYATYLRQATSRHAEYLFLTPLNLTIDTFLARQRDMSDRQIVDITESIQKHKLNAEALVVGCDEYAHIYMIDQRGIVTCHDDIGFAAIGTGYLQANFQFMISNYVNRQDLWVASLTVCTAKKAAEVAPGVGSATDMAYISQQGYWALEPTLIKTFDDQYNGCVKQRKAYFSEAAAICASEYAKNKAITHVTGEMNDASPPAGSEALPDFQGASEHLPSEEAESSVSQQGVNRENGDRA